MNDNFQSVIKIFQKNNGVMRSPPSSLNWECNRVFYMQSATTDLSYREGRGLYRLANEQVWSDPDLAVVSLLDSKGGYLPDFCTVFSSNHDTEFHMKCMSPCLRIPKSRG